LYFILNENVWILNIVYCNFHRFILAQTNISYSLESAYHCGGISPYYLWTPYEPTGITMNIDTTRCKFNSTPLYFTSLGGTSSHFLAAGYTGIYSPQKNSFAIYARLYTTSNAVNMLNMSTLYKWNVHWLGVMYWKNIIFLFKLIIRIISEERKINKLT